MYMLIDPFCIIGQHACVFTQVLAARNGIKQLPAGLGHATALLVLDVSCNQLQALSGSILGSMQALTSLKLSQNALEGCLPQQISQLHR